MDDPKKIVFLLILLHSSLFKYKSLLSIDFDNEVQILVELSEESESESSSEYDQEGDSFTDNKEQAEFFKAVELNQVEKVRELLNTEKVNINALDFCYRTALHSAIEKGYLEIVKVLLQQPDIDKEKPFLDHQSPLCLAVQHNRVAIIKELLYKGVNKKNILQYVEKRFRDRKTRQNISDILINTSRHENFKDDLSCMFNADTYLTI